MTYSPTLAIRLQTSWRDIVDAERQRGAALADAANTSEAQLIYEAALDRFRHNQIELWTVALGNLELLREQGEQEHVALLRLEGRLALIEAKLDQLIEVKQ